MSRHALDLMNKAQHLSDRIDVLSKEKCPDCEKTKMGCAKMGCGGKMAKGDGTFTIGDAQRRNAGLATGEPREEIDYSESDYDYDYDYDYDDANEKPMSMREDTTPARTLPLSEGKTRDQKRGDASRGVQVKKPGFRSNEQMPMSDASASGKPEGVVDAMMARRQKEKEGGGGQKRSIFRHPMVGKSVEAGSQPGFTTAYDSTPQGVMFMSETGGQTRNAYYTTNQYPYNAEDVANKGATSVQVSLDKLAAMLNPHEGGGVSRLDDGGVLKNNPN